MVVFVNGILWALNYIVGCCRLVLSCPSSYILLVFISGSQISGVHCCCARIRLLPGHKQSTTDMYPLFITGSGLAHDGQLKHSPICEPEMDASKIQPDKQERTKQRRPKI